MRGHGTYMAPGEEVNKCSWNDFTKLEQVLCASLAGVVERVNKLISVTPVKTRFFVKLFEIIILTSNVQGTMVKLAM